MQKLLAVVERETGHAATPDTPLAELGLDSLDLLDLVLAVSVAAEKPIPQQAIPQLNTVGDLIRLAQP
jgi:acyl carrier protein